MTEQLELGDVTWDESPEGQKATSDAIEAAKQREQRYEKLDETKERQVDEETGTAEQAKLAQQIAEEDANKPIDQEQGEQGWPQ